MALDALQRWSRGPDIGLSFWSFVTCSVSESSAIDPGLTVLVLWKRPFTTGYLLISYIISYAFVRVEGVSSGVTQLHLACRPTTQCSLLQPSESCGSLCILSLNVDWPDTGRPRLPNLHRRHFLAAWWRKKSRGLNAKGRILGTPVLPLSFPNNGKPCPAPKTSRKSDRSLLVIVSTHTPGINQPLP